MILGSSGPAQAADPQSDQDFEQAVAAARRGELPAAVTLCTRLIESEPTQTRGRLLRAQLYTRQGEHAKSASDYTEVLKLSPDAAEAWQRRGEAHFRLAKFKESVADFDRFLQLAPDRKPHHWQRGISLYYAGRFADGKQQFELHQTVNPHDVENAVWHFLCTARAEGIEAARKQLIPISGDARVPMAEVHRLFAGKATPEAVLTAARSAPKTTTGEARFYAELYLGLYYEALEKSKPAREHLRSAAEHATENGYMGDVARVHAGLLAKPSPK